MKSASEMFSGLITPHPTTPAYQFKVKSHSEIKTQPELERFKMACLLRCLGHTVEARSLSSKEKSAPVNQLPPS